MRRTVIRVIKGLSARFPRYSPLVWSVLKHADKIALTFDDGPTERTVEILSALASCGAKATFFVLGSQVSAHPKLLARIVDEGHEIGIHGYDHSLRNFEQQVEQCVGILSPFGVTPRLVRTPGCVIKPGLTLRLWVRGYRSMIYSFDVHDSMREEKKWEGPPPDYATVSAGDIVLMHDDNSLCVAELPLLLDVIEQKGLSPVTLSELLGLPRR